MNAAEGRNTGDVSEADGRAGETEEKGGDMARLDINFMTEVHFYLASNPQIPF